jgi:hypothetical protein
MPIMPGLRLHKTGISDLSASGVPRIAHSFRMELRSHTGWARCSWERRLRWWVRMCGPRREC